jgi:hypothetical protein
METEAKKLMLSKTIQVMSVVALTGGLDLLNSFITTADYSWQSIALLLTGLVGILLRVVTKQPVKL